MNTHINDQTVELNIKSALHKVTPLSKYLAMTLFIILPFVGGWIGYSYALQNTEVITTPVFIPKIVDNRVLQERPNNLSSEIAVEAKATSTKKDIFPIVESVCTTVENPYPHQCYKLVDENNNVISDNLTKLAKEQNILSTSGRTALYNLAYKTNNGERFYFTTGIPDSDNCCGLVEFAPATRTFTNTDGWYGLPFSSFSESRQYIVSASKDGKQFELIDLEQGKVIFKETITSGSLISTECGFFGAATSIKFSKDNTRVLYSVYDDQKLASDNCSYLLLETKEHQIL